MELYDQDPQGNRLPPGMFWRNGTYHVSVMIDKRRYKKSTERQDFKSALRRYNELMTLWKDGARGWNVTCPTFKDFFEKTYRPTFTINKTPLKRSDPRDIKYRDDQLVQYALHPVWGFGHRLLNEVTPSSATGWTNKRRQVRWSKKKGGTTYETHEGTVTREVAFLRAVFQKAVEDDLIGKNPFQNVETEPYEQRDRVLTLEEQAKLEAVMSSRWRRAMLFLVNTGLRLEECRGIDEKTDLDFIKRTVRVTRKTRGKKKRIQNVPLLPDAWVSDPTRQDPLDIIQEQLTEDGQLWHQNPQRFNEVMQESCIKAGVDWQKFNPDTGRSDTVSPHCLRHTFATRALQAKANIYVVSQILGHASVKTTEKHYAHLVSEDLATLMAGIAIVATVPPTAAAAPGTLPFRLRSSGAARGGRS